MKTKTENDEQPGVRFWEHAGEVGYWKAMYASQDVATHTTRRLWNIAIDIGKQLGLKEDSHVLDLGCGDGVFANEVLARHFRTVEGMDASKPAIDRAKAGAANEGSFRVCDITKVDLATLPHYDAVFLMGILHHVKKGTPEIVQQVRKITNRVIVLEPNGNNLLRKCLEFSPEYRKAGEQSFTRNQIERIFSDAGFEKVLCQRLNPFSVVTPKFVFRALVPFEGTIESTPVLRTICTTNMWGFRAKTQGA